MILSPGVRKQRLEAENVALLAELLADPTLLGRRDPRAPAARPSPRAVPAGEGRRAASQLVAGKGLAPRALIRASRREAPCPPGSGQQQHPPAPRPARRQGWGGAARRAGAGRGAGPGRALSRAGSGCALPAARAARARSFPRSSPLSRRSAPWQAPPERWP